MDVRSFPTVDPNEFWASSRLAPGATIFGRPYPQEFVHHFVLEAGRIKPWREYFNSAVLSDALTRAAVTR